LGAGQVGTFAARALAEEGATVVAADLDPAPGYFARFGPAEQAELVTADIRDTEAVRTIVEDPAVDTVVRCAGLVREACARDPQKAWEVNVDGAEHIAQTSLRTGVGRLVYLSSFAVYGQPGGARVPESAPLCPRSEYGRTKVAAEARLVT